LRIGQHGSSALVGTLSEELDRINLSLLSGLSFISTLASSEKKLVIAATHASVAWPRQGIEALARAAITHYERGHLVAASEAFEAIDFACTQFAAVFDEQQQEEWRLMDAVAPGLRQTRAQGSSGAEQVFGSATTLRHLARACRRMRPAHEHAAQKMRWSRSLGFSAEQASESMRLGWKKVLEAAAAEQSAVTPLNWADLSKFMSLFFEGYEYSVEHQDKLRTGTSLMFVVHNLVDPVRLIMHQCSRLHESSWILSGALQAVDESKGTVMHGRANARLPPNWKDQIARSEHQALRLQLVTMLSWLVHLRGLFHRMDDAVEAQMTCGSEDDVGTMVRVRLDELPHATRHLEMLIATCCQARPQSTLIDILNETLRFHRALDHQRYLPAFGAKPWFSDLDPGVPMEYSKALFVVEICKHFPLFLRWFTASVTERHSFAVKYGLIQALMGFDLRTCEGGRLANEQMLIRTAEHDGCFCARALEMLELVGRVGDTVPSWEVIADAVLALRAEASGRTAVLSRQARRSPEVQKQARRIYSVISSIRVRYPRSEAEQMCQRRLRHYSALLGIIDKSVDALRVARPAAAGEAEGMVSKSKLMKMGRLMPDFTAHDLYEINMHIVALTELATDVNRRMREVFGGNLPALVWHSDCYEYDPAHAHKQMEPILEGQARLAEAVLVLARIVAELPEAKAETEAPSGAEPPAAEPAASSEQSKSSRRRGGKKGGKKVAQPAGEEITVSEQEKSEATHFVFGALATALGPKESTIEEQD
jgi:hypothetical protein